MKPKQIGKLTSTGAGVYLPEDAVTQGFAILARRRSGKSQLAGVMEETFCARGDPWVCLDPASAHWGIKYRDEGARPGQASGYEVLVVGGKYGDVALDERMGEALADIVCETNISCIIDLKMSTMAARKRFVTDFANRLYAVNETPRHIFLEEAHEFVPQVPRWEEQKLVLGALERLIKGGGGQGIGFTLISQRPAAVSKEVLTQIDNLFVLRMSGPQDLAAVKDWFDHNVGDKDRLREILGALPSFKRGEAWLLSPEWLGKLKRLQVRLRETYHAGRTPERGEKPVQPKRIELGRVIEQFKTAAEQRHMAVQEEKDIRKRNAELTAEVERLKKKSAPPDQAVVERAVADALAKQEREHEAEVAALHLRIETMIEEHRADLRRVQVAAIDVPVAHLQEGLARLQGLKEKVRAGAVGLTPKHRVHSTREPVKPPPPARIVNTPPRGVNEPAPIVNDEGGISGPQQRILDKLSELEAVGIAAPDRRIVAALVGYHARTKAFINGLGDLRSRGYIEYPQPGILARTPAGYALSAPAARPAGLHEGVKQQLSGPQQRILDLLIGAYPDAFDRAELAGQVDYHERTKAFINGLGKMRSMGIIDYPRPGQVAATKMLFPEGLA